MTYEEAIKQLEFCKKHTKPMTDEFMQALNMAIEALQKKVPMNPAGVNVVRCKDCKFYHRGKTWHCDKVSYFENGINDMFYCAWGENAVSA